MEQEATLPIARLQWMKGKLSQNISMRRLNSDETISCELAGDYAFPNINIQIHLQNIDTYSDIE